jgi:hypothetical protein
MSSESNLKELFENWNNLNNKIQEFMAGFDLANVKALRKKQQVIEDIVYDFLKKKASDDILKIIPEHCGELEIGYDKNNNEFYFVMIDPDSENSDDIKLIAFTIDLDASVRKIENFEIEE